MMLGYCVFLMCGLFTSGVCGMAASAAMEPAPYKMPFSLETQKSIEEFVRAEMEHKKREQAYSRLKRFFRKHGREAAAATVFALLAGAGTGLVMRRQHQKDLQEYQDVWKNFHQEMLTTQKDQSEALIDELTKKLEEAKKESQERGLVLLGTVKEELQSFGQDQKEMLKTNLQTLSAEGRHFMATVADEVRRAQEASARGQETFNASLLAEQEKLRDMISKDYQTLASNFERVQMQLVQQHELKMTELDAAMKRDAAQAQETFHGILSQVQNSFEQNSAGQRVFLGEAEKIMREQVASQRLAQQQMEKQFSLQKEDLRSAYEAQRTSLMSAQEQLAPLFETALQKTVKELSLPRSRPQPQLTIAPSSSVYIEADVPRRAALSLVTPSAVAITPGQTITQQQKRLQALSLKTQSEALVEPLAPRTKRGRTETSFLEKSRASSSANYSKRRMTSSPQKWLADLSRETQTEMFVPVAKRETSNPVLKDEGSRMNEVD